MFFLYVYVKKVFGHNVKKQQLQHRIIGGSVTTIQTYPYQIELLLNGGHRCGGTIVSKKYIVTAAHCTVGFSSASLRVRAGSSYKNGTSVPIAFKIEHPQYNTTTQDYDIAIIKLVDSLSYNASVKSVPLASSLPTPGSYGTASGWGRDETNTQSYQLKAVQIQISSQDQCRSKILGSYTPRMLCAGYTGPGGKSICPVSL